MTKPERSISLPESRSTWLKTIMLESVSMRLNRNVLVLWLFFVGAIAAVEQWVPSRTWNGILPGRSESEQERQDHYDQEITERLIKKLNTTDSRKLETEIFKKELASLVRELSTSEFLDFFNYLVTESKWNNEAYKQLIPELYLYLAKNSELQATLTSQYDSFQLVISCWTPHGLVSFFYPDENGQATFRFRPNLEKGEWGGLDENEYKTLMNSESLELLAEIPKLGGEVTSTEILTDIRGDMYQVEVRQDEDYKLQQVQPPTIPETIIISSGSLIKKTFTSHFETQGGYYRLETTKYEVIPPEGSEFSPIYLFSIDTQVEVATSRQQPGVLWFTFSQSEGGSSNFSRIMLNQAQATAIAAELDDLVAESNNSDQEH